MANEISSKSKINPDLGPKVKIEPKLGPKLTTKTGCLTCDLAERAYCIHLGGPGDGDSSDTEVKKDKQEEIKQVEGKKALVEEAKIKPAPKPNYNSLFQSNTPVTPKNISELLTAVIDNNIISIYAKGNVVGSQMTAIQKVFDEIIKLFNEFKVEWMKQNSAIKDEYKAEKTKDGRGLDIRITDPEHRKSFLDKLLSLKLIPTPKNKQEEEKHHSPLKPRNPTSTKLERP